MTQVVDSVHCEASRKGFDLSIAFPREQVDVFIRQASGRGLSFHALFHYIEDPEIPRKERAIRNVIRFVTLRRHQRAILLRQYHGEDGRDKRII